MKGIALAAALPVALGVIGCAPHRLDPGSARDIQRLAVVSRVAKGPVARVLHASETDRALAKALAGQVRPFEMAERVRTSLLARMPPGRPWSQVMPAIEVATALESLLVVDRAAPTDFGALRARGADAVLLLEVAEYGVRERSGAVGLFVTGQGRLFLLDGGMLWSGALDFDQTDPGGDTVDVAAMRDGGFREAVIALVDRMSARVAPSLAGER